MTISDYFRWGANFGMKKYTKEQKEMKRLMEQGWYNRMREFVQVFFKPSFKAGGIVCGILALVCLLLPTYEELINVSVVKWTQAYYQSNVFFDIVYTCTIVLTTIALCGWIIRHKQQWIQWRYVEVLIGIVMIWGYYRFFNEIWSFQKVFNTSVSYVDIWVLQLLALITCMVVVNIGVYRKYMRNVPNSTSKLSILQSDNPISQVGDDVMGRRHFTKYLAGIVRSLNLKESSYSIAVTAPWGDGKTSFVNLLKSLLENPTDKDSTEKVPTDKIVVDKTATGIRIINFTPWLFSPGTSITKAFYLLLARELGGINKHLSNLIKRYLELLDANFDKGLSRIYEKDTLQKVRSDIEKLLKSNKGKVVVIIDDIDRLSSEEILEVFKLIRGSANFPNIVFISCFDKEYVNTALQIHSGALKNTYIEKFFQLEFSLPRYNKEVLRDMAERFAVQLFVNSSDDLNDFKDYIKKPESSLLAKMDIVNYFANPRQLIRWLNNLYLSYSAIKGECYVADLSDITLLKMYYPSIYSLISDSFEKYFTISNSGVKLWDKTENSNDTRWLTETHEDLHDSVEYSNLNTTEKENINAIFSRLTGRFSNEKALRFATPGYSMRYFFGMLQEDEVSQTDFLNLLKMEADEMIAEIDKNYLARIEGLTLLCQTVDVDDPQAEENIIRMVLYLSSQSNRYAFDVGKLMSRLEKIGENNDERKKKLMELIQTTPLSAWVSTVFSRSHRYYFPLSRGNHEEDNFLSGNFMDEVQLLNMKKAYKAKLGFTEMRELYRLSCHNFLTDAQLNSNMLKAEELDNPTDDIMRDFIIETMDQNIEYLYYVSERNTLSNGSSASKAYGITWPFNFLWNSWKYVVTYASSKGYSFSNNDRLNELGELFDKYKAKCEAVEFELTHLNPPMW